MRRMGAFCLALAFTAALAVTALAAEEGGPRRTYMVPTQKSVEIAGEQVVFQTCTVYDEQGYETNYVKLRDVAYALMGTQAQFSVEYDGSTKITTGAAYSPDGTEMNLLPQGGESGMVKAVLTVDGVGVAKEAILVRDAAGGGYTYFKLRDLGEAMGFPVEWDGQRGIYIDTQPLETEETTAEG